MTVACVCSNRKTGQGMKAEETPTQRRARLNAELYRRTTWEQLDPAWLKALVERARQEDLAGGGLRSPGHPAGDVSTPHGWATRMGHAQLVAREPLVVCGLPLLSLIAEAYSAGAAAAIQTHCLQKEGEQVQAGSVLARLSGPADRLLHMERIALNFVQHLSGIATLTGQYARQLQGSATRLLDTRKTLPGYRALQKVATATGGGWNHRMGLFDRVMLKDNHLAAAEAKGGAALEQAVRQARQAHPQLVIEVEVDALQQLEAVLNAGPDVVLLDNFTDQQLCDALKLISGQVLTEASGNITLQRLGPLKDLGLSFVSTGATVHRACWVDIGMDWL